MKFFLPVLLALLSGGCCIRSVTKIHNVAGRDVSLTVVRDGGQEKTLPLKSGASVLVDEFANGRPIAFIVADNNFKYTFADLSALQSLSTRYVSHSRFTSDFPCKRITRWIAIVPNNGLWAARFGRPTDEQPRSFPLLPSKKESVK